MADVRGVWRGPDAGLGGAPVRPSGAGGGSAAALGVFGLPVSARVGCGDGGDGVLEVRWDGAERGRAALHDRDGSDLGDPTSAVVRARIGRGVRAVRAGPTGGGAEPRRGRAAGDGSGARTASEALRGRGAEGGGD